MLLLTKTPLAQLRWVGLAPVAYRCVFAAMLLCAHLLWVCAELHPGVLAALQVGDVQAAARQPDSHDSVLQQPGLPSHASQELLGTAGAARSI